MRSPSPRKIIVDYSQNEKKGRRQELQKKKFQIIISYNINNNHTCKVSKLYVNDVYNFHDCQKHNQYYGDDNRHCIIANQVDHPHHLILDKYKILY